MNKLSPQKLEILKKLSSEKIIESLKERLTPERFKKLEKTAQFRTHQFVPLLENIHDTGNINAVMRTAENFGFGTIENIPSEKLKHSSRITQGAEKWIEFKNWNSTKECLDFYKQKNYTIAATTLTTSSIDFKSLDYTRPTVMIFGNEKRGVSKETLEQCDYHCQIKTVGLCESFNISVAAAIVLSHVREIIDQNRLYLPQKERNELLARYLLTHFQDSTIQKAFN